MLEYLTGGLAILVGVLGVLAWVYHRGRKEGMDTACERRIKEKIDGVIKAVADHKKEDHDIHEKLFDKIDEVKNLIIQHLSK